MKNEQILQTVVSIVSEYQASQGVECDINQETTLFGDDAILDSMGLVNVVIDLESEFLDKGIEISLTSEKAMSRRNSPFRTIDTLVTFISELINEH